MSQTGAMDLYNRLCAAFGKDPSHAQAGVYVDHLAGFDDDALKASEPRIFSACDRFPSIGQVRRILDTRAVGSVRSGDEPDPRVVEMAARHVEENPECEWYMHCLASGRACVGSDCEACEFGPGGE